MTKKATLKEVARAAGVSAQTVSRVVNQRPDVADDTRLSVQQKIQEMGYQPNTIARSLITRNSRALGVVATGLEYYGPSTMLIGIQQEAETLGYSLTLMLTNEPEKEDFSEILFELGSRQVDGIIWATPPVGQNRSRYLTPMTVGMPPFIFLNQPDPVLSVVSIDNRHGAELGVSHLIEQGYHKIGIISGPAEWWESTERVLGWKQALHHAGQEPLDSLCVEGDWTAASGEQAFLELLQRHPDLDAVFSSNDQMALGALKAADSKMIQVPGQLGIVGFDDYPDSAFFIPALTTIRQPLRELGAAAVREVVQMIRSQKDNQASYEPKTIILQPKLIVRSSSIKS
jgi:LacI family transcriptional regulator